MVHDWESLTPRILRAFTAFLFASAIVSLYRWSIFPFLFGVFTVLVVIPLIISAVLGRFDPFEPIVVYSVFTGLMGVVIFERRYFDRSDWRYDIIPYSLDAGLLIVLIVYIGLMASILVGYYGSEYVFDFSDFNKIAPSIWQTNADFLRAVGYFYIGLGFVGFVAIVVTTLGGNPLAMYTSTRPRSETFATSSHWMFLTNGLPIGYLLCLSAAVIDTRQLPLRWIVIAPFVVGLFVVTGSRGRVVIATLLIVSFCFYCVRFRLLSKDVIIMKLSTQLNRTVWAIIGFIGAIVASIGVTVAGGLRMANSPNEIVRNLEPISIATAGVNNDSIDNFLALTQLIPAERSYYYGSFYVRSITNFIPRAIWEGKPVLTLGSLLRRRLLPEAAGGRPPEEIGTYYANFGYPGILLMGSVFGILMRSLYELLQRNRMSPLVILFFVITVLTVGRNGLDNNTLFTFLNWMAFFVPVVVGHIFLGNRLFSGRPWSTK